MKTAVVIQARFDSTRLPGKALMNIAGTPLLVWTMRALKQVPADMHILATDADGFGRFSAYAGACGYRCIAGPKEHVLNRFCTVIRETGADIILRATGDNPYLFYEAAAWTLAHFEEQHADYFTLTGLPHGSGTEVFSAAALLDAAAHTDDPYDCEHVGPALYRHPDRYRAVFMEAPAPWNYPQLRTTVDTLDDFKTACRRSSFLPGAAVLSCDCGIGEFMSRTPPACADILAAAHPVVLAPCVAPGRGTGHLRRCLRLLADIPRSFLYLPPKTEKTALSESCGALLAGIPADKIVRPADNSCALVVVDGFRTSVMHMRQFRRFGPVLAIDEGGRARNDADFLLDVLPGLPSCPANITCPDFIPLPEVRREIETAGETKVPATILISIGGEDPRSLSQPAAAVLSSLFPAAKITVTGSSAPPSGNCTYAEKIDGLPGKLAGYDLVVTHYGFTAFEAVAVGCRVLLLGTSRYHERLSAAAGFSCIPFRRIRDRDLFCRTLARLFERPSVLPPSFSGKQKDLAAFIAHCADTADGGGSCPVCHCRNGAVIARTASGTFRRCGTCTLIYRVNFTAGISDYGVSYFFEEYAKQYGKTYLEDFSEIKRQGLRRAANIKQLLKKNADSPAVLDIGCAYGPFLAAAQEQGFRPFGVDIPEAAVDYVRNTLNLPAISGRFPGCAEKAAALVSGGQYDAVTMWWVIEHFADLEKVLSAVAALLKPGGVFAFATPSAAGVSAVYNRRAFYDASPADHYTVWSPRTAAAVLRRFGFTVATCISTGHHPERFPRHAAVSGVNQAEYDKLLRISRKKKLGDSFEVYAVKGK